VGARPIPLLAPVIRATLSLCKADECGSHPKIRLTVNRDVLC
jgi:hypothetical protein